MDIILIGAQGAGKGTQAEKLSQALGISHIASGVLFRQALEECTVLGLQAKAYLDRGDLVPDDLTTNMIVERIKRPDCLPGILLDGFPRTISQAHALDQVLRHLQRQIDLVIFIDVPRTELLKRLSGRYLCRAYQHAYNLVSRPPAKPGICDLDGSPLYQRSDDTGEAIQRRLDIFFNETIHLLDYYRRQQKLVSVNGNQDIDQVHRDIIEAIERVRRSPVGEGVSPLAPGIKTGHVSQI
jgi:adenylate kinase